jgi:hypothetical protein
LYIDRENWRIPRDIVATFVERGGVIIVADVDVNKMRASYPAYAADLRFFGAFLDGYPDGVAHIRYVRDDTSNKGSGPSVLCPWPASEDGWPRDAYDGVGRVLAIAPVALEPQGHVLLWSSPTADVRCRGAVVDCGRMTPLATAAQHGPGYAALIAAGVSSDTVSGRNADNVRWLRNLAAVLHERAVRERRLRHANPRSHALSTRGPNAGRTTEELVTQPEGRNLEHKQAFAFDSWNKRRDSALSDKIINRICGFWNAEGGTVLVGVEDRTGRVVGLAGDLEEFRDADGLVAHVSDKLDRYLPAAAPSIEVRIDEVNGMPVLRIDVPAGDARLFKQNRFFVRENNTNRELAGEALQNYLQRRWPDAH